jgi:hypothetical protein
MDTISIDTSTLKPRTLEPRPVLVEPFSEDAEWILQEHEKAGYDAAELVARYARIGERLERTKAAIKAELGHGAWGPWTKRNLRGMSDRTIRRYMEVYRRYQEPLALEDPAGFLAQIHGHRKPPPTEGESATDAVATAAPPDSKTDAASVLPSDEEGPPTKQPAKKAAKAKTLTPTDGGESATAVPGQKPGSVSLPVHVDLVADEFDRVAAGFKRESFGPLRAAAAASGNERLAAALERMERDLDNWGVRLRGYRAIAS